LAAMRTIEEMANRIGLRHVFRSRESSLESRASVAEQFFVDSTAVESTLLFNNLDKFLTF